MRGPFAALLSFAGGMLSVALIILLLFLFKNKISYIALSVAGAIAHNIGQLIVACLIMQNMTLFIIYLPILLIAGAVLGTLTGILLEILIPIFNKAYTGGGYG
jgi:heptaprenyl diphosphate synthase